MSAGWSGRFEFGESWATYVGPADQNALHSHVAAQVVLAPDAEATVLASTGASVSGRALLIRPLAAHVLEAEGPLWLIYLEPESALCRELLSRCATDPVVPLPGELVELFSQADSPASWVTSVTTHLALGRANVDARLRRALDALREQPGSLSVTDAATRCHLSPARLRALAHAHLGVPLVTWVLWRKLECAGRALAAGASLADAATVGGFADQPHLTRAMRRMFGITPSAAAAALTSR